MLAVVLSGAVVALLPRSSGTLLLSESLCSSQSLSLSVAFASTLCNLRFVSRRISLKIQTLVILIDQKENPRYIILYCPEPDIYKIYTVLVQSPVIKSDDPNTTLNELLVSCSYFLVYRVNTCNNNWDEKIEDKSPLVYGKKINFLVFLAYIWVWEIKILIKFSFMCLLILSIEKVFGKFVINVLGIWEDSFSPTFFLSQWSLFLTFCLLKIGKEWISIFKCSNSRAKWSCISNIKMYMKIATR